MIRNPLIQLPDVDERLMFLSAVALPVRMRWTSGSMVEPNSAKELSCGPTSTARNQTFWDQHSRGRYCGHSGSHGGRRFNCGDIFGILKGAEIFEMGRTLKQLIECYRTDPDSNFSTLQYQVRVKHDRLFARLSREFGGHQLKHVFADNNVARNSVRL